MDNIVIGQRVLINGTNSKRKAKEGIPINRRAVIYSISHGRIIDKETGARERPTMYNVQEDINGHKHSLLAREFKLLEPILRVPAEAEEEALAEPTEEVPQVAEEDEVENGKGGD